MTSNNDDKSLDLLGVKPIGKSIEKLTDGTVDGAKAFLGRICLPVAEEFGLLLQDKVKGWRANNAAKLAQKAEQKLGKFNKNSQIKIHPRLAHNIIEEGSWLDDDTVHDMWAGLLASSCNESGDDDSNIIFIGILKQLTSIQIKVLSYSVDKSVKYVGKTGLPVADPVISNIAELKEICGIDDLQRIDRELDHLRTLGLIESWSFFEDAGLDIDTDMAHIGPSPLALNLYVRGKGFPGSATQYWQLKEKSDNDSFESE